MRWRLLLPTLIAVVVLGACSGDEEHAVRIVQPGAPGEGTREISADKVPQLDETNYSEADVAFLQGMIPHHLQALEMTALVPDRTHRDDLPLLAERMDLSQESEIEVMRDWLERRGEPVPEGGDHTHHHGDGDGPMPGMLTEAELAQLAAAKGEEFDRLFLESMIRHHEGALLMVQELFATDYGGLEPEINQIASHIESDQLIEIDRMRGILAEMDDAPKG